MNIVRNIFGGEKEPAVQKFYKNDEGDFLKEDEIGFDRWVEGPTSVVIQNPKKNLGTAEAQEAIRDWNFSRKPAAGGEDWIDVENDPLVRYIKTEQEKEAVLSEPTALQKKYEEMGLEYDYSKRKETGSVWSDPEARMEAIKEINPDFAQRHIETDKVVNLRQQLVDNYDREMGRLNALEMQVWSNPSFAASPEGKSAMQLIRRHQQMAESLYQKEDARLDNQYYEKLPPKDMAVANMILQKGFRGKEVTYYTNNHGDIRDSVNEALLGLSDDLKEEFTNRVLGDYVRDNQGNIVRNELGEELRSGSDIVTLSPAGTYDFRVTPDAFRGIVNNLLNQYSPLDNEAEIKRLRGDMSNLDVAINNATDTNVLNDLETKRGEVANKLGMLLLGAESGATPTVTGATATATGAEQPTESAIEIEEDKLNNTKLTLLKASGVTENADGTLSYSDNLSEDEKELINDYNKQYEELLLKKSGRSPFLEGTGLATVGRGIGVLAKGAYEYSEKAADFLPGVITPGKVARAYGGISDFLSGFSESGRQRILEEEKAKARRGL